MWTKLWRPADYPYYHWTSWGRSSNAFSSVSCPGPWLLLNLRSNYQADPPLQYPSNDFTTEAKKWSPCSWNRHSSTPSYKEGPPSWSTSPAALPPMSMWCCRIVLITTALQYPEPIGPMAGSHLPIGPCHSGSFWPPRELQPRKCGSLSPQALLSQWKVCWWDWEVLTKLQYCLTVPLGS